MSAPLQHEQQPSLAKRMRERLYPLLSTLVAKSSLVEGRLKGSGLPCRLLLVHNCLFSEELSKRSFAEPPEVVQQQVVFLPTVATHLRARRDDYDVCIAVVPQRFSRSLEQLSDFKGWEEVRQIIDTSVGWDELRSRFSSKKRQVSNNFEVKNGLSYRISREAADFDLFYHRMFAPLIRRRFGPLADVDPYDQARTWFERGFLILIEKDGHPVAAALSEVAGDRLLFRRSGVLDGDETHIKAGVQTALYYFQLRYAVDSSLAALDTLKTAPILNDGVFKHKADWGAEVLPDDEAQRRVFYILGQPAECQAAFFEINPLVIEAAQGLAALVGRRGDVAASAKAAGVSDQRAMRVRGVEHVVEVAWPPQ